jgi:hypothetical protein
MKLRVRGDSLRLRLTQSEVQRLIAEGAVEERTHLGVGPTQAFRYRIELVSAGPPLSCSLEAGAIVVRVIEADARAWALCAELALEGEQAVHDGARLRILVEKDLACLKPRSGEDDSDAFPNPGACDGS